MGALVVFMRSVFYGSRGRVARPLLPRLFGMLWLGATRGFRGWYMVKSGLVDRLDVSQYRLTAHLCLAFAIYLALIWTALALYSGTAYRQEKERLRAARTASASGN